MPIFDTPYTGFGSNQNKVQTATSMLPETEEQKRKKREMAALQASLGGTSVIGDTAKSLVGVDPETGSWGGVRKVLGNVGEAQDKVFGALGSGVSAGAQKIGDAARYVWSGDEGQAERMPLGMSGQVKPQLDVGQLGAAASGEVAPQAQAIPPVPGSQAGPFGSRLNINPTTPEQGLGNEAVAPGTARAWSSKNPTQSFDFTKLPVGQQPAQKPSTNFGQAGASVASAGPNSMGGRAGADIGSFYESLGIPLGGVIGAAQQDEAIGRNSFERREQDDAVGNRIQQMMNVQKMANNPAEQNMAKLETLTKLMQNIQPSILGPDGRSAVPNPQYLQMQAAIGPLMESLGMGGGQQQGAPQEAQQAPGGPTNDYPGVGGAARAFGHSAVPAAGATAAGTFAPRAIQALMGAGKVLPGWGKVAATLGAGALTHFGLNKAMNAVDPGGEQAAQEHPFASLGGMAVGGVAGYKGAEKLTQPKAQGAQPQSNAARKPTQPQAPQRRALNPPVIGPERQLNAPSGPTPGLQFNMPDAFGNDPKIQAALQQFQQQQGMGPIPLIQDKALQELYRKYLLNPAQ